MIIKQWKYKLENYIISSDQYFYGSLKDKKKKKSVAVVADTVSESLSL